MRKQLNLHIDKVHFVPRKVNREHSKPKHILLKLLNYGDKKKKKSHAKGIWAKETTHL